MPYASPEDLPSSIRDTLPEHAQRIFMAAFNSAHEDGASEQVCNQIAWSAVKKSYTKGENGWEPIKEADVTDIKDNYFDESYIESNLSEKSITPTGTARIRIIKPGWGSSGYYSETMLERDAAKVYTPGLHMFLNHPTPTEEKGRPERDLKDLAGVIEGNVKYEKNHPDGPGVYADAHIFAPYREMIREMAPFIGLSHRALGLSKPGQAEGRSGPIIESLEKAHSVDFVTLPGAGGGIVQMYESFRENRKANTHSTPNNETHDETPLDESMTLTLEELKETRKDLVEAIRTEVLTELKESETEKQKVKTLEEAERKNKELSAEVARLTEAQAITQATQIATEAVKTAKIPELAKPRLVAALVEKATMKDGKLDEAAFKTAIEESIKTETDFYAKLMGSGKVKGMGGSPAPTAGKDLKESFKQDFIAQGKSPEMAEKMAEIAVSGRR